MNDLRDKIADGARAWHSGHMLEDRILFLDGEAIIIDKPAGLAVDAPRDGSASLEDALDSLRFGFQRAPSAVHRLDRDTSGCLLLARNPKAHRRFSSAFEAGEVKKTYIAVLEGVPGAIRGRITLPLAKRSTREAGWRMVPDRDGKLGGKPATTEWELLGEADGRALVLFRPGTGRTHQLRVHAAAGIGHAIVGDPVYGPAHGPVYGSPGGKMLLHALSLSVPRAGKPTIAAEAVPPAAFDPWRALLPLGVPADAA